MKPRPTRSPERHSPVRQFCWTLGFCLLAGLCLSGLPGGTGAYAAETIYEQAELAEVRERCATWLEQTSPEALPAWEAWLESRGESATQPLSLIIQAVRLGDESTRELLDKLQSAPQFQLPGLLEEKEIGLEEEWLRENVRLQIAQELSQRQLFEEALDLLTEIPPRVVVDPAGYFFHKAVCQHHLLHKEEAEADLTTLLNQCRPLPTRYRMLGELMRQDLASFEEKSLNEISRKMRDVERRLDLGRSGQRVQKLEREIIDSLDELIAKLEEQAGGGGGGGGSGQSQGNDPSAPAQESRVKGSTAPGEVENKDLGRKDGWGDLPPKEQAQAKQILGTMFPPHYQRAIEAYNRKNAQRENQQP